MKNLKWQAVLLAGLLALTIVLYVLHFWIFRDARHIFIYLLGDVAFLPVQVLFVTLIIDQLLRNREKRVKLRKLNMVIGTFFSDAGNEMLRLFLRFEKMDRDLRAMVLHDRRWEEKDGKRLLQRLQDYRFDIDPGKGSWSQLKAFLASRRDFLLLLLGNPNLLEHDKFTDLLWSVFHLTDELLHREGFDALPPADLSHLAQDLGRAFRLLLLEWLAYMQHLKRAYPYLFSLAIRTHPFDPDATPIIR